MEIDLYDENGKASELYATRVNVNGLTKFTPRATYYLVIFEKDQTGRISSAIIGAQKNTKAYKNILIKLFGNKRQSGRSITSRKSGLLKKKTSKTSFSSNDGFELKQTFSEEIGHGPGGDAHSLLKVALSSESTGSYVGRAIENGEEMPRFYGRIVYSEDMPHFYGQIVYKDDGTQLVDEEGAPLLLLLGSDLTPITNADGSSLYAAGGVLLSGSDNKPLVGLDGRSLFSTEGQMVRNYDGTVFKDEEGQPAFLTPGKVLKDSEGHVLYSAHEKTILGSSGQYAIGLDGRNLQQESRIYQQSSQENIEYVSKPVLDVTGSPIFDKDGNPVYTTLLPHFGDDGKPILDEDGRQLYVEANPLYGPDKMPVQLPNGSLLYVGELKRLYTSKGKAAADNTGRPLYSGNVKVLYGAKGKPIVGNHGKVLYGHAKKIMRRPDGGVLKTKEGTVMHWPSKRPLYTKGDVIIYGGNSRRLKEKDGKTLAWPDGKPKYGVVGDLKFTSDGQIALGPDGLPIYLPPGRNMFGLDGNPISGLNWTKLVDRSGRPMYDEKGRPLYGVDGDALYGPSSQKPMFNQKGEILKGEDGKPMYWPDDSLIYNAEGEFRDLFYGKPIIQNNGKLLLDAKGAPVMAPHFEGMTKAYMYKPAEDPTNWVTKGPSHKAQIKDADIYPNAATQSWMWNKPKSQGDEWIARHLIPRDTFTKDTLRHPFSKKDVQTNEPPVNYYPVDKVKDTASVDGGGDWAVIDPKCIKRISELQKRPQTTPSYNSAKMTDADYLLLLHPHMGKFKQSHGTYL